MSDDATDELAGYVSTIIKALLVAGRKGAPAEGRLPFNPLYFHILRLVGAVEGCRPSHLADELGVARTTVSTALKALGRRNLVTTGSDPTDGRALIVALTAEGRDVRDAILRQDRRNAAAMLAALPEPDQQAFVAALGKVAAGLERAD